MRFDEAILVLISLAVRVGLFSRRGCGNRQGLRLWNFWNGCSDFVISGRVVFDILGYFGVL